MTEITINRQSQLQMELELQSLIPFHFLGFIGRMEMAAFCIQHMRRMRNVTLGGSGSGGGLGLGSSADVS